MSDRFVALEKFTKVADATDATNNTVTFTVPYTPSGYIAQIVTVTSGVIKTAGLTVTRADAVITVAATDIVVGDVVSLICL